MLTMLRRLGAVAMTSATISLAWQARADAYAYEGDGSSDFGVIDLTTGVFTSCGNSNTLLSGLGVGGDQNLYGGAFRGTTFNSIDRTNGKLTAVATSNVTFWLTGSTLAGVFAVGTDANLYSMNLSTGQGHLIGPTNIAIDGGYYRLSTNSSTLYYTKGSTLYRLNLGTGAATMVGVADAGVFGAEVLEGGKLYAGSESPLAIYTLNIKTGASTLVSNVSGTSGTFWGLVPIKAKKLTKKNICSAHKF